MTIDAEKLCTSCERRPVRLPLTRWCCRCAAGAVVANAKRDAQGQFEDDDERDHEARSQTVATTRVSQPRAQARSTETRE